MPILNNQYQTNECSPYDGMVFGCVARVLKECEWLTYWVNVFVKKDVLSWTNTRSSLIKEAFLTVKVLHFVNAAHLGFLTLELAIIMLLTYLRCHILTD